MEMMIEVQDLTKYYGPLLAVSRLDFQVAAGEIVGFLGPNGAGKTTTLKILAGFSGAVRRHGQDQRLRLRHRVPGGAPLPGVPAGERLHLPGPHA